MTGQAKFIVAIILMTAVCSPWVWAQAQVADGSSAGRRLNTMVCEIVNRDFEESPQADFVTAPWKQIDFSMPATGWIYLRVDASLKTGDKVSISLDDAPPADAVLVAAGGAEAAGQRETMRFIPGGAHKLQIWTEGRPLLRNVTLRSVPEIFLYMIECFEGKADQECYSHSLDFLERTILRNCNLVVSPFKDKYAELASQWQKRGGKWLGNQTMERLHDPAGDYLGYWKSMLSKPMYDGVIHDELTEVDAAWYEKWAPALTGLSQDPSMRGKMVYLYCGWGAIAGVGQSELFLLDHQNAALGAQSLRCLPPPKGLATFRQGNIVLDPRKEYTLSTYMKIEGSAKPDTSGYSGTMFIINSGWYSTMGSNVRPAPGATEWRRYSKTFKPAESSDGKYELVICAPAGGALCVDAVQLEEGAQASPYEESKGIGGGASRNLLVNGSFEQGWQGWWGQGQNFKFLLDMVSKTNTKLAPEAYMDVLPDEAAAQKAMTTRLGDLMAQWKAAHPGIEQRLDLIFSAGNGALRYSNDKVPSANYKVLLDMQFHEIASDEAFTGLSGVGFWSMHYIDEELVRWYSALFRHYLIEGKKERLSADPYTLRHIENPGFENGEAGWQLAPAAKDSLSIMPVAKMPRGGNYTPVPEGKRALLMKRSDQKPNTLSQPIRDLTPGRLYSLKFYTAEPACGKVLTPASRGAPCDMGVTLDGVEVLNDKGYDRLWNVAKVFWTMHYRIFRARSPQGKLTLSDWADGSPANAKPPREIVLDFVQVEPYFEEQ